MMVDANRVQKTCRDCGCAFTITDEEVRLFEQLAWTHGEREWQLPNRCTPCRRARREARLVVRADDEDKWLRCRSCGEDFFFGAKDRGFYASRAWLPPTRCRSCRRRA
jgi:hypothetical protein